MRGSHPVTLRYFAAARAAAGCASEEFAASTLADAVAQAGARHGDQLASILEACTLLVDGERQSPEALASPLRSPLTADALPPFAGG